jgi:hypothetical protein
MSRRSPSPFPTATAAALASVHVRPGRGLWLLLAADLTRSLAMALGAFMVPRLAPREDSWKLEWAGALVGLPWGTGHVPAWWLPWALLALGVATALSTLACFALRPRAMSMRRRLGLLAVLEVLLPGPGGPIRAVLVTLWTGAVWVGLLVGGLALSREVVRVTGEEGLEVDPSRPRL